MGGYTDTLRDTIEISFGRYVMKCPVCDNKEVSVSLHSDGYAEPLLECIECGSLWIATIDEIAVYREVA